MEGEKRDVNDRLVSQVKRRGDWQRRRRRVEGR